MRRDERAWLLLFADGCSYATVATMTGCSSRTIALWKQRFAQDGVAGLAARYRGSKPTVLTPALEARIMTWTRRPPPHGATHWSTRSLGRKLGVQHTIVARAWQRAGLQPHSNISQTDTYLSAGRTALHESIKRFDLKRSGPSTERMIDPSADFRGKAVAKEPGIEHRPVRHVQAEKSTKDQLH